MFCWGSKVSTWGRYALQIPCTCNKTHWVMLLYGSTSIKMEDSGELYYIHHKYCHRHAPHLEALAGEPVHCPFSPSSFTISPPYFLWSKQSWLWSHDAVIVPWSQSHFNKYIGPSSPTCAPYSWLPSSLTCFPNFQLDHCMWIPPYRLTYLYCSWSQRGLSGSAGCCSWLPEIFWIIYWAIFCLFNAGSTCNVVGSLTSMPP